jgi:hypothetical protein
LFYCTILRIISQVLIGPENDDDGSTWYFSLNNRRLWVLKRCREEGLLLTDNNRIRVRVRAPKSKAEADRYTVQKCAIEAKVMREAAVLPTTIVSSDSTNEATTSTTTTACNDDDDDCHAECELKNDNVGVSILPDDDIIGSGEDVLLQDDDDDGSWSKDDESDSSSSSSVNVVALSNRFGALF